MEHLRHTLIFLHLEASKLFFEDVCLGTLD
jgi:hypothetical protein